MEQLQKKRQRRSPTHYSLPLRRLRKKEDAFFKIPDLFYPLPGRFLLYVHVHLFCVLVSCFCLQKTKCKILELWVGIPLLTSALPNFSVKQKCYLSEHHCTFWKMFWFGLVKSPLNLCTITFAATVEHKALCRNACNSFLQQAATARGRMSGQEQVKRKWADVASGREYNTAKENKQRRNAAAARKKGWKEGKKGKRGV